MQKPARYPNTDSAESKSIKVLQNLLDEEWVKDHFEKRDKKPNLDGFIELVDLMDFPTGKLDVQLKTLAKGATSFSCPTTLLAYSSITTSPVLLIGIDSHNNRAYWKHVYPEMTAAKGKQKQKSFTVKFDNEIDSTKKYILDWEAICVDFQGRISKTGGFLLSSIQQTTGEGFQLHDKWTPDPRRVLLPIERDKKALKAAITYANQNYTKAFADFIAELRVQTNNHNTHQKSQFRMHLEPRGRYAHLRFNGAIVYLECSVPSMALEFREDGKFKVNDGEAHWYLPVRKGRSDVPHWFDVIQKQNMGTAQQLAAFCLQKLTQLSP